MEWDAPGLPGGVMTNVDGRLEALMNDETEGSNEFDVAQGEDGETYLIEDGDCVATIRPG